MDKLTLKDRKREEQAFRVYAREVALAQIAPMMASFLAAPHCPLRFDMTRILKLEKQLAQVFATFVEEARVEPIPPEEAFLVAPGMEDTKHRLVSSSASDRLEQLWPPLTSRGN
jgi:hypothetical protein